MSDLKLLAVDNEDLEVISAHTQDAVVRVGDMGFVAADKRFAFLMNRYAWEVADKGKGQRKRAAIHFDHVQNVKVSGIDLDAVDGVLELLSMSFEELDAPSGEVTLSFAGGGTLKLVVECLDAKFQDLGAAWGAKATPKHDVDA